MVVIAGKYKGLKLQALEGMNTRPTSARVKEDMFNLLNNYFIFEGKTSLDLFGGSGALSIEGLSRGIELAYINDHYAPAMRVIKANLERVDKNSYQLSQEDYTQLLDQLAFQNQKVDLIYLDPPFPHVEYYYHFFEKLAHYDILNIWGIVLVEAPEPLDLEQIHGLTLLKTKAYKTKVHKYIYLFRLEPGEAHEAR